MTYQGILLDSAGNPVGDGNYNITFRIYDGDETLLWTEMVMVSTVDGYFSAELGHSYPLNLPFSQQYFLSLQVQGDSEMPERQPLTLSAYSARSDTSQISLSAQTADNADLLDGLNSTDFAPAAHEHDAVYVNENQPDAITSSMIANSQIVNADISPSAEIAASKINDGSGSGLDADLLDGLNSSEFLNTTSDYGRSGVATDLYEGTSILTDRYINNDRPDTLTSSVANYPALVVNQINRGIGLEVNSNSIFHSATGIYGAADIGFDSDMMEAIGVYGYARNIDTFHGWAYGGYFTNSSDGNGDHFAAYCYSPDGTGVYGQGADLGIYYSGGLAGTGTKSCVVKTSRGPTLLYCQESPESWFEDFGEGQLQGGRAHIELDALFLETVTIDAANPMKVFVQLEGDCNGVFVSKGLTGFDVIELGNGTSSAPLSYRVVAKRSGFEDKRLDYIEAGLIDPYLYPENAREMPDPRRGRDNQSGGK